jgi:hypothetical protein
MVAFSTARFISIGASSRGGPGSLGAFQTASIPSRAVLAVFGDLVPVLKTCLHLHPGWEDYGVTVPPRLRHRLPAELLRSGMEVALVPAALYADYRDPRSIAAEPHLKGALFNTAMPGELVDAELEADFEEAPGGSGAGKWVVRVVAVRALTMRRGAEQRELLTHYGPDYVAALVEDLRRKAALAKRTNRNQNGMCRFACRCLFTPRSKARVLMRCAGNINAQAQRIKRAKAAAAARICTPHFVKPETGPELRRTRSALRRVLRSTGASKR